MSNRQKRGMRTTILSPMEIENLAVLVDLSLNDGRSGERELAELGRIFRNGNSMYKGVNLYKLSPECIGWVLTLANEQSAKLAARIVELEGRLMQVPPQEKLEIRQELPGLHSYLSMYSGIVGKINFCQRHERVNGGYGG